jgi:hypothetical protein
MYTCPGIRDREVFVAAASRHLTVVTLGCAVQEETM